MREDRNPRVSGILTTYNREDLLARVLEGLARQTHSQTEYEILVIDDGSTDRTREVVENFRGRLPLRYFHQENAGLAAAKNLGVRHSRGDIVLFLDDDDVAHPDLIAQHLQAHELHPNESVAVLGLTTLAQDVGRSPLMHFVTEVGCYLFSYGGLKAGELLDYTYFWGGRSSCKRRFLERHGLFDPDFRFGCEDIELGFRLSRDGLKVIYWPAAKTEMIRTIPLSQFFRRLQRQGESQYRFSVLHPCTEIENWCEIPLWRSEWGGTAPRLDAIQRSAAQVEKLIEARISMGMEPEPWNLDLLHRAYWRAFRATKLLGIETGYANSHPGSAVVQRSAG
jgi:glycosyltransferase involved in cell wall biosynthesis